MAVMPTSARAYNTGRHEVILETQERSPGWVNYLAYHGLHRVLRQYTPQAACLRSRAA